MKTPDTSSVFEDNESELLQIEQMVQKSKNAYDKGKPDSVLKKHTQPKTSSISNKTNVVPETQVLYSDISEDAFDFSNVKINTGGNVIDRDANIKRLLFGNKSVFSGIAVKSGYSYDITPLVKNDAMEILHTAKPMIEYRHSIYKLLFDKMVDIKLDHKITFEQWLKITSLSDYENILYSLYCATFPNKGRIDIDCPACAANFEYSINNAQLVKITDPKINEKMLVVSKVRTVEEMKKFTTVIKQKSILCPNTKLITTMKPPTLFDYVNTLRNVPLTISNLDLNAALYINEMKIPTENGTYDIVTSKKDILFIYNNLNIEDSGVIKTQIDDFMSEDKIIYSLENVVCPSCSYNIKTIPIVLEDILFTYLYEIYQL